jgi:AcrR family transcriptional regulator
VTRTKGARGRAYEEKRTALLARLRARLSEPDATRPSLRALAEAAGVSLPTLRHYFGGRDEVVAAVLEDIGAAGAPHLARAREPAGPFAESIAAWVQGFLFGTTRTPLGGLMATGLVEGLLDSRSGPAFVRTMLEPTVEAVAERLRRHQEAGEMRAIDPRHAALMLVSPLLLAVHHQHQLGGAETHPLDLAAFARDHTEAFVRAFEIALAA